MPHASTQNRNTKNVDPGDTKQRAGIATAAAAARAETHLLGRVELHVAVALALPRVPLDHDPHVGDPDRPPGRLDPPPAEHVLELVPEVVIRAQVVREVPEEGRVGRPGGEAELGRRRFVVGGLVVRLGGDEGGDGGGAGEAGGQGGDALVVGVLVGGAVVRPGFDVGHGVRSRVASV